MPGACHRTLEIHAMVALRALPKPPPSQQSSKQKRSMAVYFLCSRSLSTVASFATYIDLRVFHLHRTTSVDAKSNFEQLDSTSFTWRPPPTPYLVVASNRPYIARANECWLWCFKLGQQSNTAAIFLCVCHPCIQGDPRIASCPEHNKTRFYMDCTRFYMRGTRFYMRNRHLLLTNQITVFVTSRI